MSHSLAAVPSGDDFVQKLEKFDLMVLGRCLEIAELEIVGYMRGKKIAEESRMEYSKSEWGVVFHHTLVLGEVLVEAVASCSFAAAVAVAAETAATAVAAVVEVQEWANFAADRQMIPWTWEMGEGSSHRAVEEVLH